jgi:molybdopterin-guanine dinucleotide biosynthesis protein A
MLDLPKSNLTCNIINSDLIGIVLCGGESKRMKTDKALLEYNNKAQWKIVSKMLQTLCKEVVISINGNQWENWAKNEDENFIIDQSSFENKGPIAGILSVNEKKKDVGFFVLGIDYPFLKMENLITLFNERSENYEAVCYEKEGFIEPLCTIYEVSSLEKLKIYFENGGESLSRFLKTLKTKIIKLEDRIFLQNVNSRKEFLSLKNSTFSND